MNSITMNNKLTHSQLNLSIIILSIILLAVLIKYVYSTSLTQKTFLLQIYLYMIFSLVSIILLTKIVKIDSDRIMIIVVYIILAVVSLLLIYNDNFVINHTGLIIFIFINSILLNSFFSNTPNINSAMFITTGIFVVLTLITLFLDDKTLMKLSNLSTKLMSGLCIMIIFELVLILFLSANKKMFKYSSIIVFVLFIFIILSDTSFTILKSFNLQGTHYEQNYPKLSIQFVLDYINLLLRYSSMNQK